MIQLCYICCDLRWSRCKNHLYFLSNYIHQYCKQNYLHYYSVTFVGKATACTAHNRAIIDEQLMFLTQQIRITISCDTVAMIRYAMLILNFTHIKFYIFNGRDLYNKFNYFKWIIVVFVGWLDLGFNKEICQSCLETCPCYLTILIIFLFKQDYIF